MTCGIYFIQNKVNGKVYVGSATDIKARWREHRFMLRHGTHHSKHLQNAFDKYGSNNIVFSVREIVTDDSQLIAREQFWINHHRSFDPESGYNVLLLAGSSLGYRHRPEVIQKLKMARVKYVGNRHPMYGRKHSDESKRRISESRKGKAAGVNHPFYGRSHSGESRRKISKSKNGVAMSDAHKKKIRAANTGKYIGGRNNNAVLDEDAVREIRTMLKNGESGVSISRTFNISPGTVSMIKNNRIWVHVE